MLTIVISLGNKQGDIMKSTSIVVGFFLSLASISSVAKESCVDKSGIYLQGSNIAVNAILDSECPGVQSNVGMRLHGSNWTKNEYKAIKIDRIVVSCDGNSAQIMYGVHGYPGNELDVSELIFSRTNNQLQETEGQTPYTKVAENSINSALLKAINCVYKK